MVINHLLNGMIIQVSKQLLHKLGSKSNLSGGAFVFGAQWNPPQISADPAIGAEFLFWVSQADFLWKFTFSPL